MRGIIVTSEYEANGSSFEIINSHIDPNKLRQYLLYWDKIDFPNNNIVSVGSYAEIEFLKNVGVLKRTEYMASMNGLINFEKLYLNMQMNAFKKK